MGAYSERWARLYFCGGFNSPPSISADFPLRQEFIFVGGSVVNDTLQLCCTARHNTVGLEIGCVIMDVFSLLSCLQLHAVTCNGIVGLSYQCCLAIWQCRLCRTERTVLNARRLNVAIGLPPILFSYVEYPG